MMENRSSQKVSGTILALCIIFFLLFTGGMWLNQKIEQHTIDQYYPTLPTDNSLESAELNAQIKFPASARDIHAHTGPLESIISVGFKMDASDLETFMESTSCERGLEPAKVWTYKAPDWWHPKNASILMECYGKTPQHVQIDMSDPDTFIVFVSN